MARATTASTKAVAYKLVVFVADRNATYLGVHADINFTIDKATLPSPSHTGTQTISGVAYAFNTYGETTRKTTTAAPATTQALPLEGQNYTTYTVKKGDSF